MSPGYRTIAQATGDDDYFTGAPELAVEVISPSESAADVQRKVELMLAAGAKAVWVVYPKTQSVTIHTPDGVARTLGAGGSLIAPFLLEGWSAPVAELFAD
jgi:Uma2 family endonuclease